MRKRGILESSDERIFGTGAFVEKMAAEAEGRQSRLLTGVSALKEVSEIIETIYSKEGVNVSEVKGGSRRR